MNFEWSKLYTHEMIEKAIKDNVVIFDNGALDGQITKRLIVLMKRFFIETDYPNYKYKEMEYLIIPKSLLKHEDIYMLTDGEDVYDETILFGTELYVVDDFFLIDKFVELGGTTAKNDKNIILGTNWAGDVLIGSF